MKKFLCIFMIFFSNYSVSKEQNTRLNDINIFSIGNNGFIGEISEGEKIYRIEKEKKFAYDFFMKIANNKSSTPESKLYAACYLKEKYPKESLEKNKNVNISLLKGDVLRVYKFNDIYINILKYGCD
ncbi:hypothetical protein VH79_25665 [Salmonella enterica]|uniref:Uncharacterized protein n=1 Tax=Salmonella enterica TaxID=28901 RepID=A0A5U3IWT4_SALER|nr:hypothetical protein [Salmonella enterica]